MAEFYQPLLQKWLRLEHEDNANQMGIQAGLNMAGEHEPYQYLRVKQYFLHQNLE